MNSDLDMTMDEDAWVKDHPVYCPVPWCSAHKLRVVRCGDSDGPYVGIHVARIRYVATWNKRVARRVKQCRDMGVENPEFAVGFGLTTQDAIDHGMMSGRRGRRP